MSKKIILILFSAILFLGARFASAEVIFSEIAWKGTATGSTHEWIELYNTDTVQSKDISSWIIKDGGDQLNILIPIDSIIQAGSFYIIKRTTSDITPYDFSTVFNGGLSDTGEKLILADSNGVPKQTLDFSLGWPDENMTSENTMQFDGTSWVSASPTPKQIYQPPSDGNNNNGNSNPPPDTTGGGTTSTTTSTTTAPPEPKPKVIENPTMKAKIIANTLAFTGEPLEMQTKILGYLNENVVLGRAYWNFGDGSSFVQVNNFEKFSHTYYYPGEYAVFLEYYLNSFSKTPEATSKMIIKVLPTTVTISKVGDAKDFFIELTNNASSDIDVSNWVINASGKIFILPKNSVIMSKKQMTISGKITGFVYGDQYNLKLFSGSGELISDYNSSPVNESVPEILTTKTTKTNENNVQVENKIPTPVNSNLQNDKEIPASDLTASAILSDTNNNDKNSNKSYFFFWGFIVLLIVSGGAVYYIRQGKNVSKVGDDFKIIDE